MSSGSPMRPSIVLSLRPSSTLGSSSAGASIGVLCTPGQMQFTRTPRPPHSIASDFVRPTTPYLLALYAARAGRCPRSPRNVPMFTMLPEPRASIPRPAACAHRKAPVRFTSTTKRKSSGLTSALGSALMTPAPFTRTSIPPKVSSVSSTARATSSAFVTSAPMASERRPRSSMRRAVSSARFTRLPSAATSAPASARPSAIAAPRPVPAPVTRAALPSRRNLSSIKIALLEHKNMARRFAPFP